MAVRLAPLSLCACCALLAAPALAQTATRPGVVAGPTIQAAPAAGPAARVPVQTVAASGRIGVSAAPTTVQAAGSVIVLADGIVANATMAQIAPPAPGFEYER